MSESTDILEPRSIEEAILMLKTHLGEADIAALLELLEALARAPHDHQLVDELTRVFDSLGILQGAVLTYAPCLAVILPDRLFQDEE